jgi:hypothetical protein
LLIRGCWFEVDAEEDEEESGRREMENGSDRRAFKSEMESALLRRLDNADVDDEDDAKEADVAVEISELMDLAGDDELEKATDLTGLGSSDFDFNDG